MSNLLYMLYHIDDASSELDDLPPILGKAVAAAAAASSDFSYENALNAAVGEDPASNGVRPLGVGTQGRRRQTAAGGVKLQGKKESGIARLPAAKQSLKR